MSEAHCNNLPQRKALGLVTHDNTGGPFVVECQGCGEVYPSFHCIGGEQIADTGDHEDARCPHCDQVDPQECDNAALAWNTQQLKINELQRRLNAADQRIDDLAAAAEPFAKVADLYAGEEDNAHEPARDMGMHNDLRLTLGQFRALRDLCIRPLMVGCKKGILCGDVSCECKGNGFVERKTAAQPFTQQFIEDHLGKMPIAQGN